MKKEDKMRGIKRVLLKWLHPQQHHRQNTQSRVTTTTTAFSYVKPAEAVAILLF